MPVSGKNHEKINLPDGVSAEYKNDVLTIKGKNGSLSRTFKHPHFTLKVTGSAMTLLCELPNKRENALFGTWLAHINNLVKGVTNGFSRKMKIVYSHFPIKVSVRENTFVIENFIGERHPRTARILGETKVLVSGDQVIIKGNNLENVSQTAANIELSTRIKRYDPRVFQDGIYLVSKGDD